MEAFRKGEIDVLVSSDAMARGMDIEGVKNVINYDMAPYVKTYIHRAGRTARAGQLGRCFTLLRKSEVASPHCSITCLIKSLCLVIWVKEACMSIGNLRNGRRHSSLLPFSTVANSSWELFS